MSPKKGLFQYRKCIFQPLIFWGHVSFPGKYISITSNRKTKPSFFLKSCQPEEKRFVLEPQQITMFNKTLTVLVGGFNPSEKYARQNGSLPQIGVKIKNIWNHHLAVAFFYRYQSSISFLWVKIDTISPKFLAGNVRSFHHKGDENHPFWLVKGGQPPFQGTGWLGRCRSFQWLRGTSPKHLRWFWHEESWEMLRPSHGQNMEIRLPGKQPLLLISINFTPKTSHSCLKKWYTRFSTDFFWI